jgi:hypothetical protein
MRALTSLNLSFCGAITALPAEVGGLPALTSLDLRICGSLTSPLRRPRRRSMTICSQ